MGLLWNLGFIRAKQLKVCHSWVDKPVTRSLGTPDLALLQRATMSNLLRIFAAKYVYHLVIFLSVSYVCLADPDEFSMKFQLWHHPPLVPQYTSEQNPTHFKVTTKIKHLFLTQHQYGEEKFLRNVSKPSGDVRNNDSSPVSFQAHIKFRGYGSAGK